MTLLIQIVLGAVAACGALALLSGRNESKRLKIIALAIPVLPLIYVVFALVGVSNGTAGYGWLGYEVIGLLLFGGLGLAAFRFGAVTAAVAWAVHAIWDATGHFDAAFVPAFYPGLCIGFDVVVAGYALYSYRES
ncbi:MAG: hypothetical protein HKN33_01425 [Pyrinomonadaceae bacterium]|nr:hypothetical protein [Pyrinomonadaceae bacterium]